MTQSQIDIIKNEIASRLPYGVMVDCKLFDKPVIGQVYLWHENDFCGVKKTDKYPDNWDSYADWRTCGWEDIKPYLRPMDSMTDGERKELLEHILSLDTERFEVTRNGGIETVDPNDLSYVYFGAGTTSRYIDWLNKHMFDYRGLIPMGSALPAPDGMYDFSDTTRTV